MISTARQKAPQRIDDPSHHLAGPFVAPASSSSSPTSPPAPVPSAVRTPAGAAPRPEDVSIWLRWAVSPLAALAVLAVPPLLALPPFLLQLLLPSLAHRIPNPFPAFFFLSHPAPPPARPEAATTAPGYAGQLYVKGPGDLALLAWTIVLVSLFRLLIGGYALPALARRCGITKEGRLVRFGEQGYAVVYFAIFGAWGVYIMSTSRTWWFTTEFFWRDYPHNHLSAPMKRYYLTQIAYWLQQFLVLTLALEKRRSDHWELVIHHCVTVWMVSWSYLMNVTLLGNAVFMSMDIPDMFLSFSKILNYLGLERAKVVSLGVFFVVWTYFRHYISLRILWSLQYEFHLVPEYAQIFSPRTGLYMATWMRDQMFYSLCILQVLNLFWYYLIWRIIVRSIMTSDTDDSRSDDSDEDEVPAGVSLEGLLLDGEPSEKGLAASVGRDKKTTGTGARTGAGGGLTTSPGPAANGKTLVDVEAAGLFEQPCEKEE